MVFLTASFFFHFFHFFPSQRRKKLDKEAIRAKRGAYQAYDDEEFEGEIGPGAKRKVID